MLCSDPCGTATGHGNRASDLCETMISRHIILSVLEVGQAVTVGVRGFAAVAAVGQLNLLFFSGTLSQLLVLAAVHIHLLPTCRRTSTQRSSRCAPVPCPSGLCKRVDGAGPCCASPRLNQAARCCPLCAVCLAAMSRTQRRGVAQAVHSSASLVLLLLGGAMLAAPAAAGAPSQVSAVSGLEYRYCRGLGSNCRLADCTPRSCVLTHTTA